MPRRTCFWTRERELELVKLVRSRKYIWNPAGHTNRHIQQRYNAYAEIAGKLGRGRGFSARSVRDRWVNIRSTFFHNLRKVNRSKASAASEDDVYQPSWPLWRPLQFLLDVPKKQGMEYEGCNQEYESLQLRVKEETCSETEEVDIGIRQRAERTDRPRLRRKNTENNTSCVRVLDDLITAMKPLIQNKNEEKHYWFFGKHVTERLNCMRDVDAECASREIMRLLHEWTADKELT